MKKGKVTVVITIAMACFALVTIMFMQFKIINQTDITSIEAMTEQELRMELATWRQKYEQAQEIYQENLEKLQEYKEKVKSDAESSKLIEGELQQINKYLGKTDVQGEGIIIKLKDTTDEDVIPITSEDLLFIVDYLRIAGAEAISINNERIVNMSDIVYVNNTIIYVNQQRILAPYEIKAIGNPTYLESTLIGNGGYIDILINSGFEVDITKSNKVTINKYEKEIGHRYIH